MGVKQSWWVVWVAVIASACSLDVKEISPIYAVPLVKAELGVYDLLAKTDSDVVQTNPNGSISLLYGSTTTLAVASSFVSLPDQSANHTAVYSGPTRNPFPVGQVATVNGNATVGLGAIPFTDLYQLLLTGGLLNVDVQSAIPHRLQLVFTFPSIRVNGQALIIQGQSAGGASGHQIRFTSSLALADLRLDETAQTANQLEVQYAITIESDGTNALQNGANVQLVFGFANLQFREVVGKLASTALPNLSAKVPLSLFQFTNSSSSSQVFQFSDPKIRFAFEQSMVVPVDVRFNALRFVQKDAQSSEDLVVQSLPNPLSIAYPLSPDLMAQTGFTIDRNNSNIKSLLTPEDKEFEWDITPTVGGEGIHRLRNDSRLSLYTALELPLTGYGEQWILEDTTEISFGELEGEVFEEGSFRFNARSSFPIDVKLQVYFLSETNQRLDSLFDGNKYLIRSGPLNAEGRVDPVPNSQFDVGADKNKINNISQATKVVVKAELQTKDASERQEVKLFADCFVKLEVGLKVKIKVP
ncbi:MAG TPA: hypothetical protein VFV37_07640 [Luteibaculaceae bacterium]|nr:hypothetical protein [Luteibaculaceae bacterium]